MNAQTITTTRVINSNQFCVEFHDVKSFGLGFGNTQAEAYVACQRDYQAHLERNAK